MNTHLKTKRRKKRKTRYTMLVIADSAAKGMKQYVLSSLGVKVIVAFLLILLAFGFGVSAYMGILLNSDSVTVGELQEQITTLTQEKTKLQVSNDELTSKVGILSDTINEKVEAETAKVKEDEELHMPKGFPLSGTATMEEQQAPPEPIVVFVANQGISVISAGSGVVESIGEDPEYGYVIKINHGNGYISIYRCNSAAQVETGAEVARGTVLYQMTTNEQKLGYQIQYNGSFVEPMDLLEIYG